MMSEAFLRARRACCDLARLAGDRPADAATDAALKRKLVWRLYRALAKGCPEPLVAPRALTPLREISEIEIHCQMTGCVQGDPDGGRARYELIDAVYMAPTFALATLRAHKLLDSHLCK